MEYELHVFTFWCTVYLVPFILYQTAKLFGIAGTNTDNKLDMLISLFILACIAPSTYILMHYLGPLIFVR